MRFLVLLAIATVNVSNGLFSLTNSSSGYSTILHDYHKKEPVSKMSRRQEATSYDHHYEEEDYYYFDEDDYYEENEEEVEDQNCNSSRDCGINARCKKRIGLSH